MTPFYRSHTTSLLVYHFRVIYVEECRDKKLNICSTMKIEDTECSEDKQVNQARPRPDLLDTDRPVRTARTIVHHGTQ